MKYCFRGYAPSRKDWVKGFYYELNDKPYIIEQGHGIERMISVIPETVSEWPGDRIVEIGDVSHVCLDFVSDDEEVMAAYRETFDL